VVTPSPRVAPSPRPSCVPPLSLAGLGASSGGYSGVAGLGGAALGGGPGGAFSSGLTVLPPSPEPAKVEPLSPRACQSYLAALKTGGLSASLSPRSPSPRGMSAAAACSKQTPQGESSSSDSPTLLDQPAALELARATRDTESELGVSDSTGRMSSRAGSNSSRLSTSGVGANGMGAALPKSGKQMQQQEESAVPQPACISHQQEVEGLDKAPSSPRISSRTLPSPQRKPPLRAGAATVPRSPADPLSDDEALASIVVATPRLSGSTTPRLSARGAAGASLSLPLPLPLPLPGADSLEASPKVGRCTSSGGSSEESVLTARNICLTPRSSTGGGHSSSAPPAEADGETAVVAPGAAPGDPAAPACVTEMLRTTFTDDDVESFEVVVPPGAETGAVLRLTLPSGEAVEVPVPEGAVPGDKLSFELSKSSLQAVEMALSGEQIIFPGKVCKGKRLKKPPENFGSGNGGPIFEVVVPSGWVVGVHTHFQAQLGDVVAAIPVPEGCDPKTVLHVEAPKGTSKVDIVIPDDAVPGSQFVANVGGQLVNVPCPPHMKPGQALSVAVAGDSALELGEVRVAKPGKARPASRTRSLVPPIAASPTGGKRGAKPYMPAYEYNIDVGAAARGQDSPGRSHTGRGSESPGRQSSPRQGSPRQGSPRPGRQDSPGRNPPSSGRRPAPAPKRTSSPMSRAAQMLMPGSKGRRA